MHRFLAAAILVIYVIQHSNGYCCFRDPLMLQPSSCSDFYTPSSVKCPKSCANTGTKTSQPANSNAGTNMCGCAQPLGSNVCDCGLPACSCYKDTANVCNVCEQPSPMCSCLKAAGDCGCGCGAMSSLIYFPEVEYPVMAMEMKPYFYGGCYTN